ncbi:MAG: hypothetical protein ACRC6K_08080, partial [Fusobacteriaceae bacterium]
MGTTKKFPVTKDENKGLRTVTVDKQEEAKEYYIALVDKSTGTVNKVYKSGGTNRSDLVTEAVLANSILSYSTLITTSRAHEDNITMSTITGGVKGINVWMDGGSVDFITDGYENRATSPSKTGFYKDSVLEAKDTLLFTFSVLGGSTKWGYTGGYTTREGGYIFWNTQYFFSGGDHTGKNDLWHDMLTTYKHVPGNTDILSGVYHNRPACSFRTKGSINTVNRNSKIQIYYYIITRDPIKETIDINSSDLVSGKISLAHQKFAEKFGYQTGIRSGASFTSVTYTPREIEGGITIEGHNLVFPPNLKGGIYRIKLDWQSSIWTSSSDVYNSPIATGDEITINYNIVDIGEVKFILDPRIKSDTSMNWINAKGDTGTTISTISSSTNYVGLRKIEGTFSNLSSTNITDIMSMEGRPAKTTNGIYNSFRTSSGATIDEAGMKTGVNLNNLLNELIISKNNSENSQMLDNKFVLLGADGKGYAGNIKEEYGPDKYYEGTATLNMSNHSVGQYSSWYSSATGNAVSAPSTGQNMVGGVLKLGGTKLINSRGFESRGIVTKLVVTQNGITKEAIGALTNDQIQVNFPENHIGINNQNGQFYISKEKGSSKENTYEVIPYYNDVPLGKLTVKVINDDIVDIGEVKFRLDPRIKSDTSINWINTKGDVGTAISTIANSTNYLGFRQIEGTFSNLSSTNITDIISMEGRPEKYPNGIYNSFRTSPGATIDEAGMKTGVNLNNLLNELIISKNNSENPQMLNNKFELLGADGKGYVGNIKEEYGPDKY